MLCSPRPCAVFAALAWVEPLYLVCSVEAEGEGICQRLILKITWLSHFLGFGISFLQPSAA